MSADETTEREHAAEEFLLLFEAAQLKGAAVDRFVEHLKQMGARVFARFPDGRELQLPLSGFDVWQIGADGQSPDIQNKS